MLRGCFVFDKSATPAAATRFTSAECERRLIAVWNEVFTSQLWTAYCTALPEPRPSPFAKAFSADERRGTFHRLVVARLLRLMRSHCDTLLNKAQELGADAAVMEYLTHRIDVHKYDLRKKLIRALRSAHDCFELALSAAETPACAQCGRQPARAVTERRLLIS